ncbi:unnamed protein product [Arabidopsis arenosa]|uniref:TF-B3 domain-containing protein n=1 Tax=Arabidopsis arenosa TaxID=38785 RepID=A0A8S2B5V1_ARAAE|nr:unnamed protein product [Arabidopsis arenosa]
MGMYHDDHLTDSEKDMWSDLCLLVDTAVMVEEEEQRHRLLAESKCHKTVSEEEDSQKRFFYLFPRKKRSSLVKRSYTQQNPNGVSTSSSSSLLDLNLTLTDYETKNAQNHSFDKSLVYDEELRAKKGKSKIICEEEEEEDEESEKRLFEKNLKKFVRHQQQNFHNLNGASASSSFLNLRCYEPKSEKTETRDLPNPNYQSSSPSSCLTENKSRKRRAVQQRKSGKFKKAKVAPLLRLSTETPEWIFEVMRYMKADAENPRLIFVRALTNSDVQVGQSRLLIPFQQLIRNDFLTPSECRAIQKDEDEEEDEEDENIGVGTILMNQRFKMWGLRFKIWVMQKDSGHGTLNYALNWGWNEVVKGNGLKAGDKISLWTFRCRGVLCFALETW